MRIEWHLKAFAELRTLPECEAAVEDAASRIAAAAGPGFEVLPAQPGRRRAHRVVGPVAPEAAARDSRGNVLLRSLDAGR